MEYSYCGLLSNGFPCYPGLLSNGFPCYPGQSVIRWNGPIVDCSEMVFLAIFEPGTAFPARFCAPSEYSNHPAHLRWLISHHCPPGPEVIKHFSCSTQLCMTISLLKPMEMPTFSYLLAEKFSCSARKNWQLLVI